MHLPPPQLAGNRRSYLEAYNEILSSHRRSPLSSASSVIMLVTPNVDALCASRMFASLFKHDDVIYRIIPVSGLNEFERITDALRENTAVGIFQLWPLVVLIVFNSCIRYYWSIWAGKPIFLAPTGLASLKSMSLSMSSTQSGLSVWIVYSWVTGYSCGTTEPPKI